MGEAAPRQGEHQSHVPMRAHNECSYASTACRKHDRAARAEYIFTPPTASARNSIQCRQSRGSRGSLTGFQLTSMQVIESIGTGSFGEVRDCSFPWISGIHLQSNCAHVPSGDART